MPSRIVAFRRHCTARTACSMPFWAATASELPWPMMQMPFTPSNGAPPYVCLLVFFFRDRSPPLSSSDPSRRIGVRVS